MTLGPFHTASDRLGSEFINLNTLKNVIVHLLYNGRNNFMQTDLYQGFDQAYLHKDAFTKFANACELLRKQNPGHSFIVFDALRPCSVQKQMYDFVTNTPYKDYVADPKKGSLHNYGMAIDLSIVNENHQELDMGTAFDDFSDLAQPKLEQKFLLEQRLSSSQHRNRLQLRTIMEAAGFEQLPHEWWHYNAFDGNFVRKKYRIVD